MERIGTIGEKNIAPICNYLYTFELHDKQGKPKLSWICLQRLNCGTTMQLVLAVIGADDIINFTLLL
jgi:hypothetical protein